MEQTAEEKVAGLLRVTVGGVVKTLPTLKARYVPEWGALLSASEAASKPITEWNVGDTAIFSGEVVNRMIDLVVAYDEARDTAGVPHRAGVLGGRDYLLENADPQELHAALVAMAGNAFPLAVMPTMVDLALSALAAQSVRPSSTNGASTSGTKTPTRSARHSTRSR